MQVHDVVIDLPVLAPEGDLADESPSRIWLVSLVLQQADHVLKPKVTTQTTPRHLILTGDPGNGKTTISRFLTQVFRAAMLHDATNLGSVPTRAMVAWQKEWPWFVILDGLDEVTEPAIRATVVQRVVSFINEAEGDDCDLSWC